MLVTVEHIIIIIVIIKNECHSNIIVDRLQGCSHSKKLRESESRSSKVVWQEMLEQSLVYFSFKSALPMQFDLKMFVQ